MAIATNGICTYNDLKTTKSTYVNVSSDFTLTECPTFAEIEHITKSGYMFDTSGYSSNQLVKYYDLKWINLTSNVLYMEALENNFSFSWYNDGRSGNATIKYSIDDGHTWTDLTSNDSIVTSTTINKGSRIYIKASGLIANSPTVKYKAGIGTLNGTKKYKLGGNLRSLINGSSTLSNYQFANLFLNDVNLINVSTTLLPFTTLKTHCYYQMFRGCVNLESTPNLPALSLVSNCYSHIFYDCNNLHYISLMCTTTPSTTYMNNWIGSSSSSGLSALPLFDGILYLNQNAQWNIEDITDIDTPYNYDWTIKKINLPVQQTPGGAVS